VRGTIRRLPGIDRAVPGALLNFVQPEQNTKLYRSYCQHGLSGAVTWHRGKSPRQAAFFFRNPEVTFHAAQLASLFLIYGRVGAAGGGLDSRYRVGSLESGALLCQAYETYLDLHAPASISFEHAWFLLLALARHDAVSMARCEECGGLRRPLSTDCRPPGFAKAAIQALKSTRFRTGP
jgi:hypothetical protein